MVWGRGAVDMLNLTATMAVAFRRLADSGFKPKGTISYLAVADEEARGVWGADWLVDHELDDVKADYVLTESGGFQVPTANGPRLPVMVEEKGTFWSKLTVRGTPGHASSPYRTDNALVTAAEVVRRLAEFQAPPELSGTWQRLVAGARSARGAAPGRGVPGDHRRAAARARAHRLLVHAHDVRADGRARRHQDERHPRPGRHRGRHPHAARPGRRARARDARGSDRRPRRQGRDRVRRRPGVTLRDRHAALGRARPRDRAAVRGIGARAVAHDRRDRQPLLPARRLGRVRLRPVQQAARVRGLRHDVPRQRRAGGPGEPASSRPTSGSPSPRSSSARSRRASSGYSRPCSRRYSSKASARSSPLGISSIASSPGIAPVESSRCSSNART